MKSSDAQAPTVKKKRTFYDRVYGKVTEKLPPALAGALDLSRPSFRFPMGGPMNGQEHRRSMIRELFSVVDFDAIVETGTFRGSSTRFLRETSRAPVYTVEFNTRYFTYSRLRFSLSRGISVEHGDSRKFLEHLSRSPTFSKRRVFFYLDAHWGPDLPLREEITTIAGSWSESAVMIDDFQVPDDAGYGFDDYGEGKRLALDYFEGLDLDNFIKLFPSCPSHLETGRRRGSILFLSKDLEIKVPTLKNFRTISDD